MKKLSAEAREQRNAYSRAYRKNNPDKIRKYNIDYWERKAAAYSIVQRAKDLKAEGHTQREIAALLNLSIGTVNNYLNKE